MSALTAWRLGLWAANSRTPKDHVLCLRTS